MKLKSGDKVPCPYCSAEQDDIVDHYTIPGYIGERSAAVDTCWNCDKAFQVVKTDITDYEVLEYR